MRATKKIPFSNSRINSHFKILIVVLINDSFSLGSQVVTYFICIKNSPRSGIKLETFRDYVVLFLIGNDTETFMFYTAEIIGDLVRETRKAQSLTQQDLALTCGTGVRFISDLENGKPTCELTKTLMVIQTLGIRIELKSHYEVHSHEGKK